MEVILPGTAPITWTQGTQRPASPGFGGKISAPLPPTP
jgi:hypothetical protein